MALKLCPECKRHARAELSACPFCGACLPTVASASGGLGMVLGVALVACGPSVAEQDDSGEQPTTGPTSVGSSVGSTMGGSGSDDGSGAETGSTTIDDHDSCGDSCCGFYGGCGGFDVFDQPQCDLNAQDCPQGMKCAPWDHVGDDVWGSTKCVPLEPNGGQVGDPCVVEGSSVSGIDSCDIGLLCFGVDKTTNEGICVELCTAWSTECSTEATTCVLQPGGMMGTCLVPCDPLAPECEELEGCYAFEDGFACAADGSGGGGTQGSGCVHATDCAPGFACIDCGANHCCVQLCDPDQDEPCPDEQVELACTNHFDDPLVGACTPG